MPESSISRRTFAAHLASGAAAMTCTVVAANETLASSSDADIGSAKPVELWLALVKQIDPERLKSEHLEHLRDDLELNLVRSALLSRFALSNGDEPAPIFAAWRAEG